jgi:hypothetical protein
LLLDLHLIQSLLEGG